MAFAGGARPHRGSIENLESIRAGASMVDGVIHTAFNNTDLSKFAQSGESERQALEAIGAMYEGSDRRLIVTAGLAALVQGRVATESDVRLPGHNVSPRVSEPQQSCWRSGVYKHQ